MLTLQPQRTARSTGGSASFTVDLGATRTVGLIHLQNLVTDPTGTISVTAGAYSSGTVNSWATDASGVYSQNLYTGLGRPRIFIPTTPVSASSVSISVQGGSVCMIGFVGICEIWETPDDILAGSITTIKDESDIQTIPFGSTYVVARAKPRVVDCSLPPLSDHYVTATDNYVRGFDLGVINGRSSPVIICMYPDDTFNLERNSVWGLISNDQPFANRFYGYHDTTFQVKQLV
jgi:hypothetical protein